MEKEEAKKLKVGQKVLDNGDIPNCEGYGRITKVFEEDGEVYYKLEMENGSIYNKIDSDSFVLERFIAVDENNNKL